MRRTQITWSKTNQLLASENMKSDQTELIKIKKIINYFL